MPRLIDADALIDEALERYCKDCNKRKGVKNGKYRIVYEIGGVPCRACSVDDMKDDLENAPTIEPKKGKWTKHAEAWSTWWTCPECGWDSIDCDFRYDDDGWYVEDVPMSYCPCCGAKMERSEDDNA